jgi:periplasmic protein TonB
MVPSTHIEVHPEPEVQKEPTSQPLVRDFRPKPSDTPPAQPKRFAPAEGSFQSSMLEYNRMQGGSKFLHALISLTVNVTVVIIPIFLGLYFTDTLDMRQFTSTFLAAPPPPPPPPPPPAATIIKAAPPKRTFENAGKLIAPTAIPKDIAMIKEAPLPPDIEGGVGVPGGVPGGVSGGSIGGVIGGIIGGTTMAVPGPAAPIAKPKGPVRVGGRVKEPRLISRVEPVYPPLARQTHMTGSVVIDAIIDEHGDVIEMKLVSGPPLLVQAALDAVRRWKYEPTYLNDQPVPVQLNVTVTFKLLE